MKNRRNGVGENRGEWDDDKYDVSVATYLYKIQ